MAALTRETCIRKPEDPYDSLPGGTEFQFSATTSPLLRPAEESRIPLTWSLAPGGWDGLSRLQGSAGLRMG